DLCRCNGKAERANGEVMSANAEQCCTEKGCRRHRNHRPRRDAKRKPFEMAKPRITLDYCSGTTANPEDDDTAERGVAHPPGQHVPCHGECDHEPEKGDLRDERGQHKRPGKPEQRKRYQHMPVLYVLQSLVATHSR